MPDSASKGNPKETLIQALDRWHEGKRGADSRCPRHDVSLKVIAGASAGGMSAAIAAALLGEAHTPADDLGHLQPPLALGLPGALRLIKGRLSRKLIRKIASDLGDRGLLR